MTKEAYIGVDGGLYKVLIEPKTISITRAEGPTKLCGREQRATDYSSANTILFYNSYSAPEHGGYDKHDFLVTFQDGAEYRGRYDLVHYRRQWPSLQDHIRNHLKFLLSEKWIKVHGDTYSKEVETFLNTYDVGQGAVPVPPEEVSQYKLIRDYR